MELQSGQYLGETPVRKVLVGGVILTQSQHTPDGHIPPHHHINPHFTFVLRGPYAETSHKQTHLYYPGDLIFHPAQAEHSNRFQPSGAACFNVELSGDFTAQLGADLRQATSGGALDQPQPKRLMLAMVRELEAPDPFSDAILLGQTLELAGLFLRSQRPGQPEPRCVRRVKALLNELPQAAPTLPELGAAAGVSVEHLCREFRRVLGTSPGEYLRQRKVAQACELLAAHPRLTTEEVAFRVGFADASHLNKVFRKVLGTSPTAYRRGLR